jgi:branched-chain amino acid transport system permease protein
MGKSMSSLFGLLSRRGWMLAVIVLLIVAILPFLGVGVAFTRQVMLIAVYTLMVSGLSLAFGYAGEVILGQVALMAVGAYTTAILASVYGIHDLGLAIILSIIFAAVLGLVTGLPGLRLSHLSLGLITFFLVLLIPAIAVMTQNISGGYTGLFGIIGPTLFGLDISATSTFYVVCVVIAGLWIAVFRNLVLSRFGLGLRVLKQSPVLAASLGQPQLSLRLRAYVLAGVPAGVAGALFAYVTGYVAPSSFTLTLTTAVLAAAVVGGAQSVYGAAIGAALLVFGPLSSQAFERYSLIVYGVFLVLVGSIFAAGVTGWGRRFYRWLQRRLVEGRSASRSAAIGVPQAATVPSSRTEAIATSRFPDTRRDLLEQTDGETLVVRGATRSFGQVHALRGIDFEAKPGQITGLIGANGAGKTTLLNAISGAIKLDSGSVELGGVDITTMAVYKRARMGVGRTFQTPLIPEAMSTIEVAQSGAMIDGRLRMLSAVLRLPGFRRQQRNDRAVALGALEIVGLADRADTPATDLPLSTRRLLEVVRAVAGRPKVLLFDEPAAGMDDEALDELRDLLVRLRDAGATIVLIEHNISFVLSLADAVHVMNLGATLATGTADEIRHNPDVIASYLGSRHATRVAGDPEKAEADA